jgi:hypothetical protein
VIEMSWPDFSKVSQHAWQRYVDAGYEVIAAEKSFNLNRIRNAWHVWLSWANEIGGGPEKTMDEARRKLRWFEEREGFYRVYT